MSTEETCRLWDPTRGEKIYFHGITAYLGFVLARLLHELSHSIINWWAGGVFSLKTLQIEWFLIVPMGMMKYDVSNPVVVYAGPLSVILVGWYVARRNNPRALHGPCGGRNKWVRRKGFVFGFLLQALWDAAYLLPIDITPFDDRIIGDGVELAQFYQERGWEIFGTNPQYAVAGVLILLMFWVMYRTFQCGRCSI